MNEEVFNLSVRKFLKHFGVSAQREIEKSIDAAVSAGKLKGTETLKERARHEIQGLRTKLVIEQEIPLASRRHWATVPSGGMMLSRVRVLLSGVDAVAINRAHV